eukprot:g57505.t1
MFSFFTFTEEGSFLLRFEINLSSNLVFVSPAGQIKFRYIPVSSRSGNPLPTLTLDLTLVTWRKLGPIITERSAAKSRQTYRNSKIEVMSGPPRSGQYATDEERMSRFGTTPLERPWFYCQATDFSAPHEYEEKWGGTYEVCTKCGRKHITLLQGFF